MDAENDTTRAVSTLSRQNQCDLKPPTSPPWHLFNTIQRSHVHARRVYCSYVRCIQRYCANSTHLPVKFRNLACGISVRCLATQPPHRQDVRGQSDILQNARFLKRRLTSQSLYRCCLNHSEPSASLSSCDMLHVQNARFLSALFPPFMSSVWPSFITRGNPGNATEVPPENFCLRKIFGVSSPYSSSTLLFGKNFP